MALVINTNHEGLIKFLKETDNDLTFISKDKSEKYPYTMIYEIDDEINELIEPLKDYISEDKKFKYFSIEPEKIGRFMNKQNIKKLCDTKPVQLSELARNILFSRRKKIEEKDDIIHTFLENGIFTDGILADIYYATYGDIHLFDSTNKITWYNFNKYGVYERFDGTNIVIWNNIKFEILAYIKKIIDDRIESLKIRINDIKIMIDNLKKQMKNSKDKNDLSQQIQINQLTNNSGISLLQSQLKKYQKREEKLITFINTENHVTATIKYLANTYYGKHNISQIMDTIKPNCLGFNNGVYDLDTGEFRNGKKEELISLTTGYNYYTEDKQYVSYIMNLLKSMIPNEEEITYILKKSSLFLVHGLPLREFYSIVGSGANGKGVYALLLKRMLGKYCGSIKPAYFDKSIKKRDANSADPQLAKNRLSRLVICDEIESCFEIDSAKVRAMTSGNTEISGRFLYGQDIDFYSGFKLLFISNYALSFDMSAKHGDRYEQIKSFRHEFVDEPKEEYQKKIDHNLNNKINNDYRYALAMFHILVKYYNIYVKKDKYNTPRPQIMEEERNMLKIENDPVGAFMSEYTVKTGKHEDKITGNILFTAFVDYNKGGNMRIQRPEFYQQLSNKHYEIKDFHKQKVVRGIKLKKDINDIPDMQDN